MFKDIIGQNQAIAILKAAMTNNRCASSYLFTGTEGVGKRLAALSFAQVLNCSDSSGSDACGKCVSCRKIAYGNHPEVQVIAPEKKSISIDQIRCVQKDSFLRPLEGARKIYIIDNAETMTREAMNCFLKILEEPPRQVIFILITSNILGLLETIVSRCQAIKFNDLLRDDVSRFLKEKHGLTGDEASLVASLSGGSIGLALNYWNYGVVENRQDMVKLLDKVSSGNVSFLFAQAEALAKDKDNIQITLNLLLSLYRDMLLRKLAAEARDEELKNKLLINTGFYSTLSEKVRAYSVEKLTDALDAVLATKRLLGKNINAQLALETMFLRLVEIHRMQAVV